MTPYEYYTSSPYEFLCACEGYFDKIDTQAQMFRKLAAIVHGSMGGKHSEKKLWPLWSDSKSTSKDKLTIDTDMWANIKKAHGIKDKKPKE